MSTTDFDLFDSSSAAGASVFSQMVDTIAEEGFIQYLVDEATSLVNRVAQVSVRRVHDWDNDE